jgi:phosphoglycolate phosphatase
LTDRAFQAVVFDLDGTLLDTLEDLADSMNHTLSALGLPAHPVDAYRRFVGDGVRDLVRRSAPSAADDRDLATKILLGLRDEYRKRWADKSRPYPGIPGLLDELVARGLPMAVLSNKPHEFTELCVTRLLSRWRFDAVIGLDDGTPRKPDPAGALRIARRLGLEPAAFLYLGDTDTDMKTAAAAGMYAVGVSWGFRDADELRDNGARTIIDHPAELLPLL